MTWFFAALRHGSTRLLAHRWAFAIPIATLLLPATVYAVRMPDVFQARALVRVREMNTGEYGSPLPTEQSARAYATVSTVRDRLITVKTLTAIMPILAPDLPADDPMALELLKENIEFDRMSDFSFSIAVSNTDPARASESVNKLLETFLEEERGPLLRRARDRHAFYERGLEEATREHLAASRAVRQCRSDHADALPEAKDSITNELTALRTQAALQLQLAGAARRRTDFLTEQIARGGSTTPTAPVGQTTSAAARRLDQQLGQQQTLLSASRKRLAEARTHHTEKMPDVIGLRAEVQRLTLDLDATVAALHAERERARTDATQRETQKSREANIVLRRLHGETLVDATEAEKMHADLRTRVQGLESRLARLPATAACLKPLLETLEDADSRRDALRTAAASAAERETYLAGSSAEEVTTYQIAQWAVPPAKPTGPRRSAILLTAIALGALIGYGLMLLRRNFERELVSTPAQLERLLPGALVITVPLLTGGRPRRSPRWRELIPVTWVTACLLLTVWTLAAHKGLMTAPHWLEGLMGRSA